MEKCGPRNHVILCVPFEQDTVWLECTSQRLPFGFLGSFTDDRTAWACTPEGGKLLNTPGYAVRASTQERHAELQRAADSFPTGGSWYYMTAPIRRTSMRSFADSSIVSVQWIAIRWCWPPNRITR